MKLKTEKLKKKRRLKTKVHRVDYGCHRSISLSFNKMRILREAYWKERKEFIGKIEKWSLDTSNA